MKFLAGNSSLISVRSYIANVLHTLALGALPFPWYKLQCKLHLARPIVGSQRLCIQDRSLVPFL